MKTILAALSALFVTTAVPAWAEAPKIPAAQAALTSPQPPMWVIRDKDSTIYLFGSIHVMRSGVNWMTPVVRQSFDQSSELYLEIADMDDQAKLADVARTYMIDFSGKMTVGLTPEEIAELDRRLPPCGGTTQTFSIMRKWAVGLILVQCQLQALGMDPNNGVDMTLLRDARAAKKPVHGLETMQEQMEALTPDSEESELKALRQALAEIDEMPEVIDTLITAWLGGDTATIERLMVEDLADKDRDGYDRLMTARNRNWVPKIETILAGKGTVFIAVGTGHLVGDDSVIAMLEARGIHAKAVDTRQKP